MDTVQPIAHGAVHECKLEEFKARAAECRRAIVLWGLEPSSGMGVAPAFGPAFSDRHVPA